MPPIISPAQCIVSTGHRPTLLLEGEGSCLTGGIPELASDSQILESQQCGSRRHAVPANRRAAVTRSCNGRGKNVGRSQVPHQAAESRRHRDHKKNKQTNTKRVVRVRLAAGRPSSSRGSWRIRPCFGSSSNSDGGSEATSRLPSGGLSARRRERPARARLHVCRTRIERNLADAPVAHHRHRRPEEQRAPLSVLTCTKGIRVACIRRSSSSSSNEIRPWPQKQDMANGSCRRYLLRSTEPTPASDALHPLPGRTSRRETWDPTSMEGSSVRPSAEA